MKMEQIDHHHSYFILFPVFFFIFFFLFFSDICCGYKRFGYNRRLLFYLFCFYFLFSIHKCRHKLSTTLRITRTRTNDKHDKLTHVEKVLRERSQILNAFMYTSTCTYIYIYMCVTLKVSGFTVT